LRQTAAAMGQRMTGEALLALLKHPATARGADRGAHLRLTQKLELFIRRKGAPFPDTALLADWVAKDTSSEAMSWAAWLNGLFSGQSTTSTRSLTDHLVLHLALTEGLARGDGGGDTGPLWTTADGAEARRAMTMLAEAADAAGDVTPAQYSDILRAVLDGAEVRKQGQVRLDVMIWGTREARIQGADLVVLGGLNDGVWPALPPPDPWLNRDMRLQAGLLLPERRIGLAAHDYQQAVCAPKVVLTRARRDAQAETVPSRWLNRLTNLLAGLPDQGGIDALAAMRARGQTWLTMAATLDAPTAPLPASRRPAPRPPVAHRPRSLAVTQIRTLIRDPYAIYARHILNLKPLDPLRPGPDPQLRGQVLHRILEHFVRHRTKDSGRAQLLAITASLLFEEVAWPTTRALWMAKMERAADFFLLQDAKRGGRAVLLEEKMGLDLPGLDFRLTAKPDRIDVLPDGRLHLVDYKTGKPPTEEQQKRFDNQLWLQAGMAERGAFGPDLPTDVASIAYVGLGSSPDVVEREITPAEINETWEKLLRLIARYQDNAQGYAARRAVVEEKDTGDYDHLARLGEWAMSEASFPARVGDDE
jgi:ATP-dependent helicase/nuclease subunit B